jgi:uncharacterized membrane protein YgcG
MQAADISFEHIDFFNVEVTVNADASIDVREQITYDFGTNERHGVFRTLPLGFTDENGVYAYLPIEVSSITDENGEEYPFELQTYNYANIEMKIGDEDEKVTGVNEYIIEYQVANAINGFDGYDELFWNVTGTGWGVPIEKAQLSVALPDQTQYQDVICFTGTAGATDQKCTAVFDSQSTVTAYTTQELPAFAGLTVGIGMDEALVEEAADVTVTSTPSDLDIRINGEKAGITTPAHVRVRPGENTITLKKFAYDSFEVTQQFASGSSYTIPAELQKAAWAPLFQWVLPLFLLALTTLGLFWKWALHGRDAKGRGTVVAQYDPPDNLTAGEVGVLVDQKVHRHDISGSVIQLAVRGYIHLTKLEEKKQFGASKKNDYTITKTKSFSRADAPDLRPHERKILKGIFGKKKEVKLSDLNQKFYKHLPKIKDDLYDSVVEHGYFTQHPDTVRKRWQIAAGIGFLASNIVGIGMTIFLESPVFGVALGVISVQLLIYSFVMPQRSKKGSEAHEHVKGLELFMKVTEKERMQFHFDPSKVKTSKELFERLLPYAMVLKVEKEWAKQFPELDPPSWYSGNGTFNTLLFINSMSSFSSAAGSAAVSSPSSGSSGGSGFSGGFSGGGFGGGGGGSW